MKYTIDEIRQEAFKNIYNVYEIFKNHFGENYVDLQDIPSENDLWDNLCPYVQNEEITYDIPNLEEVTVEIKERWAEHRFAILVYWPRVQVTNEYDKSIDISDLYAKVKINIDGCIPFESPGFTLNRASYTYEQFVSDYMHSHIPRIPRPDYSQFQSPCLGRGPIRNTIDSLKTDNNEATWMLFCQELSMYVTVESISGVPYRRLENVGVNTSRGEYAYGYKSVSEQQFRYYALDSLSMEDNKKLLRRFIPYYLKHGNLTFSYMNNSFVPGLSYYNYMVDVSNSFIDFCNDVINKENPGLLNKIIQHWLNGVRINNECFYQITGTLCNPITDEGDYVCTFKGRRISLHIEEYYEGESTNCIIVKQFIAMYVLQMIMETLNLKYGRENTKKDSRGETSETCTRYICV